MWESPLNYGLHQKFLTCNLIYHPRKSYICDFLTVLKSNDRSEYSIGLADFFSGKGLKICSRSILIFHGGLTCDQCISIVERLSNSKVVKVTKKVIVF